MRALKRPANQPNKNMYPLATIHAINNRPRIIRDNFNRDSSACFARGGFVIHSGIHRSTLFLFSPESVQSCRYWKSRGQKALNAFVVSFVETGSLETAERNAFLVCSKEWQLFPSPGKGNPSQRADKARAWKQSGNLKLFLSSASLQDLAEKVRRAKP